MQDDIAAEDVVDHVAGENGEFNDASITTAGLNDVNAEEDPDITVHTQSNICAIVYYLFVMHFVSSLSLLLPIQQHNKITAASSSSTPQTAAMPPSSYSKVFHLT